MTARRGATDRPALSRNRNGAQRLATRAIPEAGPLPPTERGRRTRDQLIAGARAVFEERGYLDARISDISARAKVAHGTFYSYFDSKEAVFLAVMDSVNASLYDAAVVVTEETDAVARIEQSLRQYLRAWRENAAIMGIIQQVAMINTDVRRHREGTVDEFRSRIERGIRRMQEAGLADPGISTRCAPAALALMVSSFCYEWLVLGGSYEEDEVLRTLTTIWARSIGLDGVAGGSTPGA